MENIVTDSPNLQVETVPVKEASVGLDSIAAKMAAMRNQASRNLPEATEQTSAGSTDAAAPVSPEAEVNEVSDNYDNDLQEPEVVELDVQDSESNEEEDAPTTEVSESDSSSEDIIDFLEFAEQHPNAKFKFKRNGKEIEIDAKKAAAILGQGAAISEDARQLKIEKSEFDEYKKTKQAETEGLLLAMEFTVRPQLQRAYDEILKVQGWQNTFKQQLAQTQDPAERARIEANMMQNEQYLQQQSNMVRNLKPKVDQFYDVRRQQVTEVLDNSRKAFKDKELRNAAIYDELRSKLADGWSSAKGQLVPGVDNIDLITSDEHVLSLIRDGFKYRDKPKAKQAGGSIAVLTQKTANPKIQSRAKDEMSDLQAKARAGDKKAQDNLLVAKMQALRAQRGGR